MIYPGYDITSPESPGEVDLLRAHPPTSSSPGITGVAATVHDIEAVPAWVRADFTDADRP